MRFDSDDGVKFESKLEIKKLSFGRQVGKKIQRFVFVES